MLYNKICLHHSVKVYQSWSRHKFVIHVLHAQTYAHAHMQWEIIWLLQQAVLWFNRVWNFTYLGRFWSNPTQAQHCFFLSFCTSCLAFILSFVLFTFTSIPYPSFLLSLSLDSPIFLFGGLIYCLFSCYFSLSFVCLWDLWIDYLSYLWD